MVTPLASCFPPPREGRGSRPLSPLLPRRTAGGQFLRLRPASLGAPTLPPPAPAAAGGPFVRLRARAPALSLRSVESVCRSLSAEQEERRGFGEAAAGLFAFPSLSPAPHLSLPLSCPRSRSHGGAVGGHSVPISVLVVLRGRAVRARRQRRELGSLPRHGGEELRLLLCG